MALSELHALRRAPDTCAKSPRIATWLHAFGKWVRARQHPHIAKLDAHLLRDIGMTEADIAAMKHKHPSQNTTHPHT